MAWGGPDSVSFNTPFILTQVGVNQATTASLKRPISIENSWGVDIAFSVWYQYESGHMLSIVLDEEHTIEATLIPATDDISHLLLSYDNLAELCHFKIPSAEISRFHVHRLSVQATPLQDSLRIALNDDQFTVLNPLNPYSNLSIELGCSERIHWSPIWTCSSIIVKPSASQDSVVWNFNSPTGHDVVSDFVIQNQIHHDFGRLVIEQIMINPKATLLTPIPENMTLLIRTENFLDRKSYLDGPPRHYSHNQSLFLNNQLYHWDPVSDSVYTFVAGLNPLIEINEFYSPDPNTLDSHHFDPALVTDWRNGDLYLIGGYGHYRYHNEIYRYNHDLRIWDYLVIRSDEKFGPRASTTVVRSDSNKVFLLAGEGHPLGRQELGRINYTDLWEFNLDEHSLTKIADSIIPETQANGVHAVFRKSENALYVITTEPNNMKGDNSAQLHRVSLEMPVETTTLMEFESDFIYPRSAAYDELNDMFLYLSQGPLGSNGKPHLQTQAIPFPVESWSNLKVPRSDRRYLMFALGSPVLLLVVLLGRSFFRRTQAEEIKGVIIILSGDDDPKIIVDGNEQDTRKVKLRKAIELLRMLSTAEKRSRSHEEIKQALWPYVTDRSFHNSLNVCVSTIRSIIDPYRKALRNQGQVVAFDESIRIKKTSRSDRVEK